MADEEKIEGEPKPTSLDLSSDKDLICPECGCLFSMMTSAIKQSGAYVKPAEIIPAADDVTLPLFAEGVFENAKTEENNGE